MAKTVLKYLTPDYSDWSNKLYWAITIVNSTNMIYGFSPCETAFGKGILIDRSAYEPRLCKIFADHSIDGYIQEERIHLGLLHHQELTYVRNKGQDEREKLRHARSGYELETQYVKGEPVYRWRPKKNKFEPT